MFTADLLTDSLTAGRWLSWLRVGPASWEVVGSYPGPANGQTFKSTRIREVPSHLCSCMVLWSVLCSISIRYLGFVGGKMLGDISFL